MRAAKGQTLSIRFYRADFNAIPRGAWEQDSFDTSSINNIQNEENRFILWWHNR